MRTLQMRALLDSIDRHFYNLELGVPNKKNVKELLTLLLIEDFSSELQSEHCKRIFFPIIDCLIDNNCYIDGYNFCDKETDDEGKFKIENEQLSYIFNEYDDLVHWEEIEPIND